MSPRNVARLFRRYAGTTPARHVENPRLEAAQCQLESTAISVNGVADACGFANTETLTRVFTRRPGLTPARYQANKMVCRAVEDGDFSFVHNDYRLGNWETMAALEVHRWENDRIVHGQVKYLNNQLEADHGASKRRIRSMLGFKSAKTAYATPKGIDIMRVIRKLQFILLRPSVTAEARFFNKLFGIYA